MKLDDRKDVQPVKPVWSVNMQNLKPASWPRLRGIIWNEWINMNMNIQWIWDLAFCLGVENSKNRQYDKIENTN